MEKSKYVLELALIGISEETLHKILQQLHHSGGLLDSWGVPEADFSTMELDHYLQETRKDEDLTISKIINS